MILNTSYQSSINLLTKPEKDKTKKEIIQKYPWNIDTKNCPEITNCIQQNI
jgi:hypothetical protein